MVTFEFPTFVRFTVKALAFPITTLPKFKLGTLAERTAVDAIPIPLSETVLGVLEALLMIETLAANVPAAFGAKMTSKVDCFPASITRGSVTPVIVTPAAVASACVIVRLEVPPLVIVTDCDAVLPSATEPKLMEAGATEIVATLDVLGCGEEVFGAPVMPVHPEVERTKRRRKAAAVEKIALFPRALKCVAYFFAPHINGLALMFFISAICGCGRRWAYCPSVHIWYRNRNLPQILPGAKKTPGRPALFAWPGEFHFLSCRRSLWNECGHFGRVGALHVIRVDRGHDIVISLA